MPGSFRASRSPLPPPVRKRRPHSSEGAYGSVKVLLSQEQLAEGIASMASSITESYRGQPLTVVGVLTGSIVLLADLIRMIDIPLRLGVLQARSYRGTTTHPGRLSVNQDLLPDVRNRHVLLIDDILDTGRTLSQLLIQMHDMGALSVRTAVLLRKRGRQQAPLEPDYVGFEIPNEYVVGYGLDYNDYYRNLPYVGAMEPADLEAAKS